MPRPPRPCPLAECFEVECFEVECFECFGWEGCPLLEPPRVAPPEAALDPPPLPDLAGGVARCGAEGPGEVVAGGTTVAWVPPFAALAPLPGLPCLPAF